MSEATTKICFTCKIGKPVEAFGKSAHSKDGLRYQCKECHNILNKKWVVRHKEQARAATRRWNDQNRERISRVGKLWLEKNKEKRAAYIKKWRECNPEKYKLYSNRGAKKVRSTLKGRINDAFSSALYRSLKERKGGKPWEELVGYTIEELKAHIERQFEPWMTWDNYGKYTWHIDHIKPVASFNYTTPSDPEFKECWSLKNLQPLAAKLNHSKKDRTNWDLKSTWETALYG